VGLSAAALRVHPACSARPAEALRAGGGNRGSVRSALPAAGLALALLASSRRSGVGADGGGGLRRGAGPFPLLGLFSGPVSGLWGQRAALGTHQRRGLVSPQSAAGGGESLGAGALLPPQNRGGAPDSHRALRPDPAGSQHGVYRPAGHGQQPPRPHQRQAGAHRGGGSALAALLPSPAQGGAGGAYAAAAGDGAGRTLPAGELHERRRRESAALPAA